ncbi:hypothetical protein XENOCAPTIV_000711 [Xenoophorus captivus]|uniref:LIM zinc-binding domain-containing protein n=1 Tax=Xenoophorus captivus TaxID=1517983 RepID=A0ABV0RBT3_9TELE
MIPDSHTSLSSTLQLKSVIRRTKETSNVHPMYREGLLRRKMGPIIVNKSNSQDRLIEELQGKLGIGRVERRRKQQPDDWLTEGVIVMSNPQRTREEGIQPPVDKVDRQQGTVSSFHVKDGKAFCRKDYFDMFAPKCGGCTRAILENYISALNSLWHPECFVCRVSHWLHPKLFIFKDPFHKHSVFRFVFQECFTPFINGSFFDHDGQPYCESHYHERRGSLCSGCQKPITGRCITAMGKKFHPEHFVCAFCLKQLNKGTFKEQNDKPYCHGCFVKLFS